ncbi:MAG: ATP-binding cassette domain-containing protein [Pseudobdellovibrionaceae bacterium]|nr:ATP-binding cassette domain-containing protein [Bdellovibrionales bacterium]USN47276.1 MAG: ATP-binding cassette domain-containing protein [Pseudobdellovibrionaceae bacterium]
MALIEVKDFKKAFGQKVVHQGVSFSVDEGTCLALLGGSGAGKSVILRSLIGLEKPDSGQIIVDGDDITHWEEKQLIEVRKKAAYVFQNGALFDSMSVFDNLAYPLREHTNLTEEQVREKVIDVLDDFGLKDSEKLFPAELSGGMQKRVGIARSIVSNPKIVLFDEPTAGLDPFNTRLMQEIILRLKKTGVTSILVTHDLPTAYAVCDYICLLRHGRIQSQGKAEIMQKDPQGLFHKFVAGEDF